jgi:superfamily II DNA or RNA helicase
VFSLEQVHALKKTLSASNLKIPPCLILELPKNNHSISPSHHEMQDSSAKRGYKRLLKINPEEQSESSRKRQKTESIPLLENSSQIASKPQQTLAKQAVALPGISTVLPLVADQFWKNMTLNNMEKLCNKVSARLTRRNLFMEKPHHYPILDLLKKPAEKAAFSALHPFLKPYQFQEVENQLALFRKGISRLLSFKMGLGKTYVMAEILTQLIFRGHQGVFMLVVPNTIKPQINDDLAGYLAQVISIAWIHRFHNTEEKSRQLLISTGVKSALEAIDSEAPETLFSLLPLFSYTEMDKFYDLLMQNGALEVNKQGFWGKVRKLSDKLLKSLEPALLAKLQQGLLPEVNKFFVSKERGAPEIWSQETKKADSSCFWIGEEVEGINFQSPLVFAQLLYTSKLIRRYYDHNKIRIPGLESHPQGLHGLTRFSLSDIKIADDITKIQESLTKGQGIVITHYEAFAKITEKMMSESSVGAIFFDEAQKIHTSKSQRRKIILQLTAVAKRKNPQLPLLLSTATFLENNLSEPWNLLQIANPLDSSFEKETFELLQKRVSSLQTALSNCVLKGDVYAVLENETQFKDLAKALVLTFSHLEAFRQKILIPLVARKDQDDPDVKESWHHKTPERKDVHIEAKLTKIAEQCLEQAHQEVVNGVSDHLAHRHKYKLILLHPDFINSSFKGEDPKIAKAEKQLSDKSIPLETKKFWMDNSPVIANIIDCAPFKECVKNRQKGLIFVEHIKTASLIKLALEAISTDKEPIQAGLFTGKQTSDDKESILKWFREPSNTSKFLIAMKKSGSVGLNLPEASYVFFPEGDDWNPSVDDQAAYRIIRMYTSGIKTVVTYEYNIFMHYHTEAIRDVKKALENFYHVGPSIGIREQFTSFTKVLAKQFYHGALNRLYDEKMALNEMKSFEALLELLTEDLDDGILEASLQSVMPSTVNS